MKSLQSNPPRPRKAYVTVEELSDHSFVYNVIKDGQEVANPPSEAEAIEIAQALNNGSIPWLVQQTRPDQTHVTANWDTVIASSSRDAVVAWLNSHPHSLPLQLQVAPAAPLLRHANGMPMISRQFNVTKAD